MISFDDGNAIQYTQALPLLKKYGVEAIFFIITVTIDKENYMTSGPIKDLDNDASIYSPYVGSPHGYQIHDGRRVAAAVSGTKEEP